MADTQATPTQSAIPRAAGVPTEFTPSQYDITQYSYPSDLYSNNQVYGGNYVIFYINVSEDSRVLKVNKEPTVDASLVPARMQGDLAANNYNAAQTVAGIAGPSAVPLAAAGALAGATAGLSKAWSARVAHRGSPAAFDSPRFLVARRQGLACLVLTPGAARCRDVHGSRHPGGGV